MTRNIQSNAKIFMSHPEPAVIETPRGSAARRNEKRASKREKLGIHLAAMLQMNIQVEDEKERMTIFGKELIVPQNIKGNVREQIEETPLFIKKLDKLALRIDQHMQSPEDLSERYVTHLDSGLSRAEAQIRLQRRGYNEIRTWAARSRVARLTDFVFASTNALILICMFLLVVGYLLQDDREISKLWTLFPLGLTMVASSISSYIHETQSNRLRSFAREYLALTQHTVTVIRNGEEFDLKARYLVPGDIIFLHAGDVVPADMRIVSGTVYVDEKILTGIRGETRKGAKSSLSINPFEAENILFLGTEVVSGSCKGLVFHCGNSATIAKLGNQIHQYERTNSTLSNDLVYFHTLILGFAFLVGVVIGMIGQWSVTTVSSSSTVEQTGSMTVISIAGIILSSAPLLFNVVLVAGLSYFENNRLNEKGVYVSQMDFINSLASVSTLAIGSDSLLLEKEAIRVTSIQLYSEGISIEQFAKALSLTASSSSALLDSAIHKYFKANGIRFFATSAASPAVDPVTRVAVARHENIHYVRGPPEVLFSRHLDDYGGESNFSDQDKTAASADTDIVIGCLERCEDGTEKPLGVVKISNPVSRKTAKAVSMLQHMGVRIVPIFHDSGIPSAALKSIIRRAGIAPPETEDPSDTESFHEARSRHLSPSSSCIDLEVPPGNDDVSSSVWFDFSSETYENKTRSLLIEGRYISQMDQNELQNFLVPSSVATGFVNVSFSDKLRLVTALKKSPSSPHLTVAFIGGLDLDAPALRAAHLGIAASWGGLAARVSDIRVSRPDALLAVAEAIAVSRLCVNNLRKIFMYMISQVLPRMGPLLVTLAFAYPLPLSVELVVLGSLVIDLPICLALLLEKPEYDLLSRPPRNEFKDPIISERMIFLSLAFFGVLGSLSGFLGFTQVFSDYGFNPHGLIGFDRSAFVLFGAVSGTEPGLPSTYGSVMDLTLSSLSNVHLCGRVGNALSLTYAGLSAIPQTQRCDGPLFTLDLFNQYCYSLNPDLTYSVSSQAIVSLFEQQKSVAGVLFDRDPTALGTPVCGQPNYDGVFVPRGFYTTSSQLVIDSAMRDYTCATGQTLGSNGLSICFTNDTLWYGQTVYFSSAAFFAIMTAILVFRTELFSFFHVDFFSHNPYLIAALATSLGSLLLVIYVPLFNTWFGTRPLEISNLFTSAMPFFILAFTLEETRKYYMREDSETGRWLSKRTMW